MSGLKVQALAASLRSLSKGHNIAVNKIEVAKSNGSSDSEQPKSTEIEVISYIYDCSVQCAALATCPLRHSSTLSCMLEAP